MLSRTSCNSTSILDATRPSFCIYCTNTYYNKDLTALDSFWLSLFPADSHCL